MGSGLSIIPGMVDYSKTDLRFPTSGQQAHDAQIIHLVLFIHSLEMFIFSLWGLTPIVFSSSYCFVDHLINVQGAIIM